MRLRVLDDDRPGYAQLAFDGPLSQSPLAVSVRSEREGAFLGPNGRWQRSPHFFTAAPLGGDDQSALYRVGPEIVNFLLPQDIVEFAAADGSFQLETTWENAVPSIPSAGRQKGQMYRDRRPTVRSTPAAVPQAPKPEPPKPEPPKSEPAESEAAKSEPPESPPQPTTEVTAAPPAPPPHLPPASRLEMPPQAEEPPAENVANAASQEPLPEKPGFFARHRGLLVALLGLVGLAALGFGFYQFMPCGWLGKECPGEREAAEKARVCIADRKDVGRDCDVDKECVAPYLASFPDGPSASDLKVQAKTADDVCRQMEDRARGVFQCIADLKAQKRSRCDVQAACVQGFQVLYKRGPKRAEVDRAAQEAEDDCQGEQGEDQALRAARQCRADTKRQCTLPGCYVPYMDKFGSTGTHKDEAKREAVELDQECITKEAEDATLASARECAKPTSPQRCAAPGCYTAYIKEFGESGRYRFDAQREATALARECGDKEREREQERERERTAQEEERVWGAAKSCAGSASACDVRACYATYDRNYAGRGKHIAEMQQDIARAEKICSQPPPGPAVQDGKYTARTEAACGARPTSVLVEVHGNRISWEHEFQGSLYRWSGTVDSGGNVSATAPGSPGPSATGVFTEGGTKVITMRYPGCTVTFTIHGKVG